MSNINIHIIINIHISLGDSVWGQGRAYSPGPFSWAQGRGRGDFFLDILGQSFRTTRLLEICINRFDN